MPRRDHSRRLLGFPRRMRAEMTDAERRIWTILRSRKLQGFKFRRQVPMAGYILDFYCIKAKLAIELDGGQHGDAEARQYDQRRTAALNAEGIEVLRFWDHDALKDTDIVAETILQVCERRCSPSSSSPGTPGEAG